MGNEVPLAELLRRALAFELPGPSNESGEPIHDLWSTHYHLWQAREARRKDGYVVLDPENRPFPRNAPLYLTGRDWCYTALEGSGRVERSDGTTVTLNYADQKEVAVPCERWLGDRWRSQGRARFGFARGPFGDGVRNWVLVPFRTIAVDRDQQTIPYGSLVFIAEAVGQPFEFDGADYTHDGWFFAGDTGGAIRDLQIDTFTGTTENISLTHVRSSPDAARFDAVRMPNTHPFRELFLRMHESPELWVRARATAER